jgi:cytosine/adenosine deaminase-related metal-dependent hydrolase
MGARAIRLGDVTGSIAVSKQADLVLLRTDRAGFADNGSLADRVVTFAGLQDIDSVWIKGKPRKRHGQMVGVDLIKMKAQVAKAAARFRPIANTVKFT